MGEPTAREHFQKAETAMQQETHTRAARYANELLALRCGPDLLALGVFPDFKELTESFGMYRAVSDTLGRALLEQPGVALIAVGDGCTARTAATFAFRSQWTCYSVDPAARMLESYSSVRRLVIVQERVERWTLPSGHARAVIVAVHSHARLDAAVKACAGAERVDIFALPCCVGQQLGRKPDVERVDKSISSPKRTFVIWLDYREK